MATKTCYTCEVDKDLSEYNKHDKYKSGYNNHCRSCVKLKNNDKMAALREKSYSFLDQYACCACGFNHRSAKEVHHLSSEYKRYGRSQDVRYNVEDLLMGNAVVLCPTCHSLFHGAHGGKNQPFPLYTKEETIEIINKERGA